MTLSSALKGYEGLAREFAARLGARVDALTATITGRRRVRFEGGEMFLGGDAWPGAIPVWASARYRR
ncbi:hypothetical protein [Terrihabitans sp. B22-R8]|uniref:hypothetical protein n=1 Tax=Terrihabitans sp. B22-R8 TaxID=3425128 RepID=UPI00403CF54D